VRIYGRAREMVGQDAEVLREKLKSSGSIILPRDVAERILRDLDQMTTACHTLDVVQVVAESFADRNKVLEAMGGGDE